LNGPEGVALDAQGNLYVADFENNRVLEYNDPLASGMAASRVFGQADFTHGAINRGQANPSANSLHFPHDVALDAQGDLYVADYQNNRVLEYDAPLSSGMDAKRVFGQSDFTSGSANRSQANPGTGSLFLPSGPALDAQQNLYIADYGNSRVLEFDWAAARLFVPLVLR
jgi:DNA-binding beta-propeller fold protein YncE